MEESPHILVVDDDRDIRELLSRFLRGHSFRVTLAADGREMRRALDDWRIDLVVLDLMLPGENGLTLCRNLRAKSMLPVIMLTAKGEETDRIVGLEMGADDYLAKPFNPRELLARIRAVLRRAEGAPQKDAHRDHSVADFAGWRFDIRRRQLKSPENLTVDLTTGEFELLVALVDNPQRVLSREQLLDLARGRDAPAFDRSVDMQVSRLRQKIEIDPKAPELIKTVRGGGYLFTPDIVFT